MSQEKKENKTSMWILIFIIALLSGIAGSLMVKIYMPDYENMAYTIFGAENPKEKVVAEDDAISGIIKDYANNTAGIYKKKAQSQNLDKQLYSKADYLGTGSIITRDGWIVTASSALNGLEKDRLVAVYHQDIFDIENIVIDPSIQVAFIKLSTLKNLEEAKLADFSDQEPAVGQKVIVAGPDSYYVSQIENANYSLQDIKSTDTSHNFIKLKDSLPVVYQGSPIIDLQGKIAGILEINEAQSAIKAAGLSDEIQEVLRSGKIQATHFGINYIDLSESIGLSYNYNGEKLKKGALVYSLDKAGLAYKSGLAKGDIILKIEDDEIKAGRDLKDVLSEYKDSDSVKISLVRDGQPLEISLKVK